jgi:hypothetical protein
MDLLNVSEITKAQGQNLRSAKEVKAELDDISTFLVEKLGNVLPLENAFFAGGCLRDLSKSIEPKDYDIYFFNAEDISRVIEYFTSHPENTTQTSLSNWNLVLEYKGKNLTFQFITLMFGLPREVIGGFDFTINMSYYVFATEEMYLSPDVGSNQLYPGSKIVRPLHALCRITKFLGRGYTISHRDLVSLAETAIGKKLSDEEKEAQLSHLISGD